MNPHNYTWQQTMLRVKDGEASARFYEKHFGMTLLDRIDFPQFEFSLFFMTTWPASSEPYKLTPGTKEAHDFLWNFRGVTLELTWNYGTEKDPEFKYNNGNVEPHRGFGHVAFNTDDVYTASSDLESAGVSFQKKPDEGRMKGLAFALDPDGYWIEIVKRHEDSGIKNKYNLSQTMLRIKDPKKSLAFYTEQLGMKLVQERHFEEAKFSLYFLVTPDEGEKLPDPKDTDAAATFMKSRFNPVLELTHNHGTENEEGQVYHNGNTEPKGFGHIGFLVDDLDKACADLESNGVKFQKKPTDGKMRGLAFALDPDNYWIEVIQKGLQIPE